MAEVARITIIVDAGEPVPDIVEDGGDLDQCRHALQQAAEHVRDIEAQLGARTVERDRFQAQLAAQNELLRSRTVERDHFKEDSYLWGLVVARFLEDEGGEVAVRTEELHKFHGRQIEGNEEDGWTTIRFGERLPPSPEGS